MATSTGLSKQISHSPLSRVLATEGALLVRSLDQSA